MNCTTRLKIGEINKNFICVLCGGYYIDATTIIECLHSFCRTCIVTYLRTSKTCPVCDTIVHKTRPHQNIRSDKLLQDLVYKLIPGLYKDEMRRRREFYTSHYEAAPKRPGEERGDEMSDRFAYTEEEKISLTLYFCPDGAAERVDFRRVFTTKEDLEARNEKRIKEAVDVRYLQCKAAVTIGHLKKFVRLKYGLPFHFQVDMFYNDEPLRNSCTLCDVAYFFNWTRRAPLMLTFSVFESTGQDIETKACSVPTNVTPLRIKSLTSTVTPAVSAQEIGISTASSVQAVSVSNGDMLMSSASKPASVNVPSKKIKLSKLPRASVKSSKSKTQSSVSDSSSSKTGARKQPGTKRLHGTSKQIFEPSSQLTGLYKPIAGTSKEILDPSAQVTGSCNQPEGTNNQFPEPIIQLTGSCNQPAGTSNQFPEPSIQLTGSCNQPAGTSNQFPEPIIQLTGSCNQPAGTSNQFPEPIIQLTGSCNQPAGTSNQFPEPSIQLTGSCNQPAGTSKHTPELCTQLSDGCKQSSDVSKQSSGVSKQVAGTSKQITGSNKQPPGPSKHPPLSKQFSLGKRQASTPIPIAPAPAKIPARSSSSIDITMLIRPHSKLSVNDKQSSEPPKLVSLLPAGMPQPIVSNVSQMKEPGKVTNTITFSMSSILNVMGGKNGIPSASLNNMSSLIPVTTSELTMVTSACPLVFSSHSSSPALSSYQTVSANPAVIDSVKTSTLGHRQKSRHLSSSSQSSLLSSLSSPATFSVTQSSTASSIASPTPATSASPVPAAVPVQQSQTQSADMMQSYSTPVTKQRKMPFKVTTKDIHLTPINHTHQNHTTNYKPVRTLKTETETTARSPFINNDRSSNSEHWNTNGSSRGNPQTNSANISTSDAQLRTYHTSVPLVASITLFPPHSVLDKKDSDSSLVTSPTSNGSAISGVSSTVPKQSKQKKIADIANTLHKRVSDALLNMVSSPSNRISQTGSSGHKSFNPSHTIPDRETAATSTLGRSDVLARQSLQNVPPDGHLLTIGASSEIPQNSQADEPLNLVKRDKELVRFTNGMFILDIPPSVT